MCELSLCTLPADMRAVFSHRYQEFERIQWDGLCCSKKRLIPRHKHACFQHLAFVVLIINVLFWSLATECKLEQIWREGWRRGGGVNESHNKSGSEKEMWEKEQRREFESKEGRRRIDMSVKWRNGDRNKGGQEITHEATKEHFKKGR